MEHDSKAFSDNIIPKNALFGILLSDKALLQLIDRSNGQSTAAINAFMIGPDHKLSWTKTGF